MKSASKVNDDDGKVMGMKSASKVTDEVLMVRHVHTDTAGHIKVSALNSILQFLLQGLAICIFSEIDG